jgi:hypothetical protein
MPDIVIVIIIVAIIAAVAAYVVLLYRGLNRGVRDVTDSELSERRKSMKVSRVSGYMPHKYRAFYDVLKTAMPAHYIILPNTAVELLFQRANRKELQLEGQYASFCVFNQSFVPILVIQLRDVSDASDAVFIISDTVKELIQNLGIPIMEQEIRDHYSVDDLRRNIAKAMNPLFAER